MIVLLIRDPDIIIFTRRMINFLRKIMRLTRSHLRCAVVILAATDFRKFPGVIISFPIISLRFPVLSDQKEVAVSPFVFVRCVGISTFPHCMLSSPVSVAIS